MAFTLPPIAVSTSLDGKQVARFGHDFPLAAIDAAGVSTRRQAEGCCGSLAKAVADCEVVICTAIGRGAAGHLAQAGVRLAIVPEGTLDVAAVTLYRSGRLQAGGEPSACDHGHAHDHGHDHEHSTGGGCSRAGSGSIQKG
jgi:predicted Fe-Mo cluster-binding NifX family protein